MAIKWVFIFSILFGLVFAAWGIIEYKMDWRKWEKEESAILADFILSFLSCFMILYFLFHLISDSIPEGLFFSQL